jgi:hypothetical protein
LANLYINVRYADSRIWPDTPTSADIKLQLELGPTATAYASFVPNSPSDDYPSVPRSSDAHDLVSTNGTAEASIALPILRGVKLPADATNQTYIDAAGHKRYADTLTYLGNGDWEYQQRINPSIDDCTTDNIDEVYADYMLLPLPEPVVLHLGELPTFPRSTRLEQPTDGVKAWITATAKVMD